MVQAIEQGQATYIPRPDERMTQFRHDDWECGNAEFPELELKEPGPKPAGAMWIDMHPQQLGRGRVIYHKLTVGRVDLQIDGAAASARAGMRAAYRLVLVARAVRAV